MDGFLQRVFSKGEILLFDGGMGTLIQKSGIEIPKPSADMLCLTDPSVVTGLHARYVKAGSQVISTNTFNSNAHMLGGHASVQDVYRAAVKCAREAKASYVAADIGPLGELLEPLGNLSAEEAYLLFYEQAKAGADAGADLILIETMSDLKETEIAIRAAHDAGDLPIIVSMSFGERGKTYLGVSPEEAAHAFEKFGVSALGANCSTGPKEMLSTIRSMAAATSLPLIAQPNAGLPHMQDGQVVYDVEPIDFAETVKSLIDAGATLVGGCCGTEPEHIAELADRIAQQQ